MQYFVFSPDQDVETDAATYLLERTKGEIKSVKGCEEYYEHENNDPLNRFPLTGSEPHLIAWEFRCRKKQSLL